MGTLAYSVKIFTQNTLYLFDWEDEIMYGNHLQASELSMQEAKNIF